jgi:diphosphomevalonate decarboxylase
LRERGIEAYYTIDAGPNVHVLTMESNRAAVEDEMKGRFGYECICSGPGPGARIVEGHD